MEEPFSVTRGIFEGAPLDAVFTIELCAGCARLSASLSAKGFRAMAVDQKSNKHQQAYATIALDLESDEAVHFLLSLLKQPGRVLYVHAAPLCGTCARTRERKLKRALRKLGVKEPQALRSAQFPHGLPGLKGTNLKRVLLANPIYANLAKVMEHAIVAGANISIENSTRSWLWHTEWVRDLSQKYALFAVTFQQCMHCGKKDTWYIPILYGSTNLRWCVMAATTMHHGASPKTVCTTRSTSQKKLNIFQSFANELLPQLITLP